ncbi:MAG: endonuclease/exonuclease/phosphatase family protein [Marinilabilia sp.]
MKSFLNIFSSGFFQRPVFFRSVALILFSLLLFPVVAQELTVMTYNIYHGEHAEHAGESNLEEVAAVINEYQPDLVALQEVDSMTQRSASLQQGCPVDQVKELAGMTGMYGYFGKTMDFDNGGYGSGILSRKQGDLDVHRLPVRSGDEPRGLMILAFEIDGHNILFASTHLSHESAKTRIMQADAICQIFEKKELPVILGGDFNFNPRSEPYNVLLNCFKDTSDGEEEPKSTFPSDTPERRIDYVFASEDRNWRVKDVKVIDCEVSDHLPVLVTLEL